MTGWPLTIAGALIGALIGIAAILPAATEAHHHLTWRCDQCGAMAAQHIDNRCPDTEGDDRAGLLRGIAIAVPAGLAMWAALGLLITRWW